MNANLHVNSRDDIRWTGIPIENLTHAQLLDAFRSVATSYDACDAQRVWLLNRMTAR